MAYQLSTSFIESDRGPLFGIWARPEAFAADTGVLIVPPFAEEMNRSRRMLSLQARALAGCGFRTLLLDLFGTGDSWGEFGDADVRTWLKNISVGVDTLVADGCSSVVMLAVRFGGLLGVKQISQISEHRVKGLVFWQPVQSGKAFMTQFLRLRIASELGTVGGMGSVAELRAELDAGNPIDVAGYELSPKLYTDVCSLNLIDDSWPNGLSTDAVFMEISGGECEQVSTWVGTLREHWSKLAGEASALRINGQRFWQTAEITVASEVVTPTINAVRKMCNGS